MEEECEDFRHNEEKMSQIHGLCRSKAEEFVMIGYEHVTGEEVWACIRAKYKNGELPPLHQVVNDVLSLKITQFMNWMTMQAYKGTPF